MIGFGNEGRLKLLEESPRGDRRMSRIRLDGDYGIQFLPLRTEDEGDYFCIVNGRERPSRVTRILVEGRQGREGREAKTFPPKFEVVSRAMGDKTCHFSQRINPHDLMSRK